MNSNNLLCSRPIRWVGFWTWSLRGKGVSEDRQLYAMSDSLTIRVCFGPWISRPAPVYRSIECRNWKSFDLDAFKGDLVRSTLYCDVIAASDTATTLTSRYDTVLTELINKHAAARSILLRERQ